MEPTVFANVSKNEKTAERMRKYRERIKNDPEKYEKYKEKERKRKAAKSENKITSTGAKKRRLSSEKEKEDNQTQNENTETTTTTSTAEISTEKNQILEKRLLVKRKEQRVRRKYSKEINFQKEQLKKSANQVSKWKMKFYRLKSKTDPLTSPEKNVQDIIHKGHDAVKKELLFGQVLVSQLTENMSEMKTEHEKSTFAKAVSGKVMKKYKFMSKLSNVVSTHMQRKYSTTKSFSTGRSKKQKEMVHAFIKENVQNFLEKDENSANAPGAKDCVVRHGKVIRKRFLLDTLDNLHKKFVAETKIQISRATFFRVRPFWIVTRPVTSRDTCMCKTHANFHLILNRLISLNVTSIKKSMDFASSVTCASTRKDCMYRDCLKCKNTVFNMPNEDIAKKSSSYFQWQTRAEDRIGAKGENYHVKITSKEKIVSSIGDIVLQLNSQTPSFLKHAFNNRHQKNAFTSLQDNLKPHEVYMVIDFSENYVYKYAQSIQSTHFGASKKQVTLHTGAFYYRHDDGKVRVVSFCTISDCLRHDAAAVWAHLKPIFELIFSTVKKVLVLHIQSDGPSTQYKNKTNFFLFKHHCSALGLLHATYNFSEPGHGKSVADGNGGSVKNTCDRAVGRGTSILCPEDIVNAVTSNADSKIRVFIVNEPQIKEMDSLIPPNLTPIPKTQLIHQLIWSKEKPEMLYLNYLSCTDCISVPPCSHFALNPNSFNYEQVSEIDLNSQKRIGRGRGRVRGKGKGAGRGGRKEEAKIQTMDSSQKCETIVRGRGRGTGRGRGKGREVSTTKIAIEEKEKVCSSEKIRPLIENETSKGKEEKEKRKRGRPKGTGKTREKIS